MEQINKSKMIYKEFDTFIISNEKLNSIISIKKFDDQAELFNELLKEQRYPKVKKWATDDEETYFRADASGYIQPYGIELFIYELDMNGYINAQLIYGNEMYKHINSVYMNDCNMYTDWDIPDEEDEF